MTGFLLATVVIVAIVALLLAFVIKVLASTPVRIAAVIGAITVLVTALPALFLVLRPAEVGPAQGPAPAASAVSSARPTEPPASAGVPESTTSAASPASAASGSPAVGA
ncbi:MULTISPECIES: hypothetical protein [unclassified Streptomyces]|uniref:hypothetical protein n=1 Tax=unclassified Streptomyces TaxID=2593676 RepID=UPI0038124A58